MSNSLAMSQDFWRNKRVLITGHTGFKGSWLSLWLQRLGAVITGVALRPKAQPNLFELSGLLQGAHGYFCDIRDRDQLVRKVHDFQPEIVFHMAAQPLVRASYREPVETFSTNVIGTMNVLEALRDCAFAKVAVMITTDKVYRNTEIPHPFREDDPLGGHDPYSASKAASEIVIASYRETFLREKGIAVASARAGNVIGGGDWSEDRLIPDAVRAWQADQILDIRRPQAIRPWQHVLEPLYGYLALAEKLWHHSHLADAYNFGPPTYEAATVRDVVELARSAYGSGEVRYGDGSIGPHEAGCLTLETAKARTLLGVQPRWNLAETVGHTIAWYQAWHAGADARELCLAEIVQYESSRHYEAQR